jgi:hypothetical protein
VASGIRKQREARASFDCSAYFLHPEQEAQHSAEEQHDAFAAFTAPSKLSAITATKRIALILFMIFSFLDERVLSADATGIGARMEQHF